MSDAAFRLDRLESDVREINASMHDMQATLRRLELITTRIDAMLPSLATKEALADKPGKIFLMTGIGLLLTAYGLGLAALVALPVLRTLVHL